MYVLYVLYVLHKCKAELPNRAKKDAPGPLVQAADPAKGFGQANTPPRASANCRGDFPLTKRGPRNGPQQLQGELRARLSVCSRAGVDQTCPRGAQAVFPLRKCRRSDGAFVGGLFVPPPRQRSLQARHRPCGPEPASVGENLGGFRALSNCFTVSDVTSLGPFALVGANEGEPRPCF